MKPTIFYIMIGILAAVFCLCGTQLYINLSEKSKFQADITYLSELIDQETGHPMQTGEVGGMPLQVFPSGNYLEDYTVDIQKPPNYSRLYNLNTHFAGWLTIQDTQVDCPVMQTVADPQYYLHRGFDQKYSKYGLPFIAEECDLENSADNILIYGHNMKDGSIFGGLPKYEDPGYRERHPIIRFDTLERRDEYRIIAIFKTSAADGGFPYYQYIHLDSEEVFREFMEEIKSIALYMTDEMPVFGARLLTLSTCEYTLSEGRFVIVAQLK